MNCNNIFHSDAGFFWDCQALRRLCSIKRSTSPVESVTYNFVPYKKLPSCMPTCHPFICKQRLYALFIATGILLREMSCGIVPLKTRLFPASKSLPLLQVKGMMYSKVATNWNSEWLLILLTGKLQFQNNQVRFLSQCYGYNTFYMHGCLGSLVFTFIKQNAFICRVLENM